MEIRRAEEKAGRRSNQSLRAELLDSVCECLIVARGNRERQRRIKGVSRLSGRRSNGLGTNIAR